MYEKKAEQKKPPTWVDTAKRLATKYPVIEVPSVLVGGAIGGTIGMGLQKMLGRRAPAAPATPQQIALNRRAQEEMNRASGVMHLTRPDLTHARSLLTATPSGRHRAQNKWYAVPPEVPREL